jgi:hypothetical protein
MIPTAIRSARSGGQLIGLLLIGMTVSVFVSGCSQRPGAVYAPDVDADAAAERAMSLYDADKNGELDKKELESCPGILNAILVYDGDNNQQVNVDEIAKRVAAWKEAGPAMVSVDCRVTLDGQPLEGATVRFVPEPYLEGPIRPASGVTETNGLAAISLVPEDMPSDLRRVRAMNAGTYRVEITHPTVTIPEKYNTRTTLGREVSKQTSASPYEEFKLTSK